MGTLSPSRAIRKQIQKILSGAERTTRTVVSQAKSSPPLIQLQNRTKSPLSMRHYLRESL
jgi:hypothetical protein